MDYEVDDLSNIKASDLTNTQLLTLFRKRFNGTFLYGIELQKLLNVIGEESIKNYMKESRSCVNWKPVTSKDQIKVGTKIKIIGFRKKDSIRCISVKKIIPHFGTEIILKKKENLYFNLGAYLGEIETVGRWVREVYYQ